MAQAKTVKFSLTFAQQHTAEIFDVLQTSGAVQINQNTNDTLNKKTRTTDIADCDYQRAGVQFAIDFLSPFDTAKKSLQEKMSKHEVTTAELNNIIRTFDHQTLVEKIQEIESAINQATNRIDKAKKDIELLTPWAQLSSIPSKESLPTEYTTYFIEIDELLYPKLIAACQQNAPLSELQQISKQGKRISAIVIFNIEQENVITTAINETNAQYVELPELDEPISDHLKHLERIISESQQEVVLLEQKATDYVTHLSNFKVVFDHLSWKRNRLTEKEKLGLTESTATIIGWIDQKNIKSLSEQLQRITDAFMIEEIEKGEEESAPVIYNNRLAQPFESITDLYGAPKDDEPDPTPFLAPFFTLFFGMAMTDAGYGLILGLLLIFAIKYFKIPRENQKLLRALIWGSFATFVLGVLTGSYFAIDLAILPAGISAFLQKLQLVNPIADPLIIFNISLLLGVFQVLVGISIDLWWKLTHQQVKDGLLGPGAWLLTLITILGFAGSSLGMLPAAINTPMKYLMYIGLALVVYNGTRGTKNIFLKPGIGILGLYSIIGYLSDVLSYSRLLALGLTTGVIGLVVNIFAELVIGLPVIGWLLALIVLVGGHAFNIIINGLGAFIHSSRLQYIEFFPKFIEAGGDAFEPFNKQSTYIRVTP